MRFLLIYAYLLLSSVAGAQTIYQGFQYVTRVSEPKISAPAGSTAYCQYGTSSDPVNHPPGCWIGGDFGDHLISVGRTQPLNGGGAGTLICQGQVPLVCTLEVVAPGQTHHGGITFPPVHTQGSYNNPLGPGYHGHCNEKGLTITTVGLVEAGQLSYFVFDAPNLGDGKCIVNSGGEVNWGDGTWEYIPSKTVGQRDKCAQPNAIRITFSDLRLGHMFMTPGPVKIQASMGLMVTDKTEGTISQRGTDARSGSWECHAVRWEDFTVVVPSASAKNFQKGKCRTDETTLPCAHRAH